MLPFFFFFFIINMIKNLNLLYFGVIFIQGVLTGLELNKAVVALVKPSLLYSVLIFDFNFGFYTKT